MNTRFWIMRVCQLIAGRFPGPFYHVAARIARVTFRLRPGLRQKLIRNMEPFAGGDAPLAERLARRCLENVCRYYVDLCSLPHRRMETFEEDHLELVHGERLAALQDAGPVVAISAHTGNAELAIQALTYRGRPFVALVEALRPAKFARYMRKLRSSTGGKFYEANFQGIRACIETLHSGGLVGFMGDRDLQGNGLCTKLSGRCVRLPRGPWEIARKTNAMVFPIFTSRVDGDRFVVYVEEPFRVRRSENEESDVAEAIERFAALLEAHLQRDPGQWAVTENFWKAHSCG